MPRYYTKSQMILEMTEDLLLQDDQALVEKVQRSTGMDFLNEDDFSEEALWEIAQMSEEDITEILRSLREEGWNIPIPFGHPAAPSPLVGLGHSISGAVGGVGSGVAGGLHGVGLHSAGALATAHPIAAGAAAIGLGAAAALRMRSNMRARAQARASGMQ